MFFSIMNARRAKELRPVFIAQIGGIIYGV